MDLDELRALIAFIEHGSVPAAARAIDVPRTTIARRLASLEADVGSPLYVKDGRDPVPTATGRVLVSRGRLLLDQASRLHSDARRLTVASEGLITVLMGVGIHPLAQAMVVIATRARFPGLRFEVRVREDPVALLATEGDFALLFAPSPPEGPWIARRVTAAHVKLLARPEYLQAAGTPTCLEDLDAHPLFLWSLPSVEPGVLPLRGGGAYAPTAAMLSTDPVVGWEAARAGVGIALAPDATLPGDGWAPEDKVAVLPDLVGIDMPVWVVAPGMLSRRPALKAVIDHVVDFMAAASPE
ncbi:MAG TPA: LysR family transcriptional regulator [Myxococcota bacterium]|nr:LysR family transcriptional regulator [Myxococcota bacterium]